MFIRRRAVTPVVHLNRFRKAQMIEAIVEDYLQRPVSGYRILDIGCGNGDISAYFASRNEQYGVDVCDRRKHSNYNFHFRVVDSEVLPYGDGYFDVVMSHHVIEHVNDQNLHLSEVRRVLKKTGVAYLATPNRTSPLMKGHVGNDLVLKMNDVAPLLERNRFFGTDYAPRVTKEPDRFFSDMRLGRFVPLVMIRFLRRYIPSHIYVLRPQ